LKQSPSGQPISGQLIAALTTEHSALLNFVVLLEREQSMLIENSTDQLLELSEQKSNAAIKLNDIAQASRTLLQKYIPKLGVDSIQAWLQENSPEGLPVWQKSLALAKRSQQLNRANGELIQMKLRHNQQSLAVLSNAVNRANLYGPDGQPNFSVGSGRSLGNG
jgi:flagellar biosynthesis protein FlgN